MMLLDFFYLTILLPSHHADTIKEKGNVSGAVWNNIRMRLGKNKVRKNKERKKGKDEEEEET